MLLYTNRPDYYNDICEEIRLFVHRTEITLCGADIQAEAGTADAALLCAVLTCGGGGFHAETELTLDGKKYTYSHDTPYSGEEPLVKKRFEKRCLKIAVFRVMRSAFPNAPLPWGSLTGIRPTRLLRELTDGCGQERAARMMLDDFDVSPEKLRLAEHILSVQSATLASLRPEDVDVYIGIPFCRTRCLYCSFASQLRTDKTDMDAYLTALKRDIANGAGLVSDAGLRVRALYFGGGTPTVLTADELDGLLDFIMSSYSIAPGIEFTVEAGRPDTITAEKLRIIKSHGATRISVNPQTMCDATLRAVGRDHTAEDICRCFMLARETGFDSINMDLIAGLPGECADDMRRSIDAVIRLAPDCLTVHTLAVKRSSRLHEHLDKFTLPDARQVELMTAIGAAGAEAMGMFPYYMYRQKYMTGNMENVGYSMPGKVCVYNIDMMEDALSIIAHGAGAMTKRVFPDGQRIERVPNSKDIDTYISKLDRIDSDRRTLFGL